MGTTPAIAIVNYSSFNFHHKSDHPTAFYFIKAISEGKIETDLFFAMDPALEIDLPCEDERSNWLRMYD